MPPTTRTLLPISKRTSLKMLKTTMDMEKTSHITKIHTEKLTISLNKKKNTATSKASRRRNKQS